MASRTGRRFRTEKKPGLASGFFVQVHAMKALIDRAAGNPSR